MTGTASVTDISVTAITLGPEICDDGVDNDGDQKVDCDDKKDCNAFCR